MAAWRNGSGAANGIILAVSWRIESIINGENENSGGVAAWRNNGIGETAAAAA
jgi:hypothetical protein